MEGKAAGRLPVGVVIPASHAAGTLDAAVAAVAPDADIVVLAVDPADAPTWACATGLAAAQPNVRVVPNPGGRTPTGLNRALAEVAQPAVARIDAHTVPAEGYLVRALAVLRGSGAAVVGGRQVPVGEGPVGRAVALAMTTTMGSGGAQHLVGRVAGPSETAYLGVFDRGWLDRVGGWDERLDRNQDYEVCHRIRQAGGVVHFDPILAVAYRPRDSWRALAGQYHEYGRWKRHVMTRSPASIRPRQLAAPVLVAGLAGSVVLRVAGGPRGAAGCRSRRVWVLPGAWLAAIGATASLARPSPRSSGCVEPLAAGRSSSTHRPPGGRRRLRFGLADRARVAVALAVMHLAWGTGWWRGGRP